jgi:xanthine dehydrogenase accessory factor
VKELDDIIEAYDKARIQNKQTVLATVVKVEGSSYRSPGARMLVTENGELTGAISGGCLEGDALRKAMLAIFQKKNKLVIYDSTDEDDAKLGLQLGCNGIVHILFEPLNPVDLNPIDLLRKTGYKKEAVIATVFKSDKNAPQLGTCYFVNEEENICFQTELKNELQQDAKSVLQSKKTLVKQNESNEILYQFIPPDVQLVIVGAGNDAIPLMKIADGLGWKVVVVDGRPTHATQQRFENAEIILTQAENLFDHFTPYDQTVFVLMTHNYNYDLNILKQQASVPCAYIGLLGPKEKRDRMLNELADSGIELPEVFLNKIYGPTGLDIGAENAEEIALSIIAEIKSVISHKTGSSLRNKKTQIHERVKY